MKLQVARDTYTAESTEGILSIDGVFECYTLEDAVREIPGEPVEQWKIAGATATPQGTYPLKIDFSNRFQRYAFHVENVPGFAGIRIHKGNDAADVEGCTAVGIERGSNRIEHSKPAYDALWAKLAVSDGWDAVHNCQRYRMKEPATIEYVNCNWQPPKAAAA